MLVLSSLTLVTALSSSISVPSRIIELSTLLLPIALTPTLSIVTSPLKVTAVAFPSAFPSKRLLFPKLEIKSPVQESLTHTNF
jgi:hypothetical protein